MLLQDILSGCSEGLGLSPLSGHIITRLSPRKPLGVARRQSSLGEEVSQSSSPCSAPNTSLSVSELVAPLEKCGSEEVRFSLTYLHLTPPPPIGLLL